MDWPIWARLDKLDQRAGLKGTLSPRARRIVLVVVVGLSLILVAEAFLTGDPGTAVRYIVSIGVVVAVNAGMRRWGPR